MARQATLIVLRHAHRETINGRGRDNGLSKKGKRQALALKKFFRFRLGKSPDVCLLSSPKKRCLETVEPIADMIGTEVEVHSVLDEQQRGESSAAFAGRVDRFCKDWRKSRYSITVVCAHGDWIPVATKKLVGVEVHVSKGGWVEFQGKSKSQLCWLVQRLI